MSYDLIGQRARLTPERPAVWFEDRWYRYRELEARAAKLAGRLRACGIGPGDRVGILALNHLAHIDLILAAPKLGFIYTPFNYRLSIAEQRQLAAEVEPAFLFHDRQCAEQAQAIEGRRLALDDYAGWLESGPEPLDLPAPVLSGDDIHMMLFTGGSTGLPKGALLPYRQTFCNAVNTVFSWGLRDTDCAIQATPAFHAAINVLSTPLLWLGGRVVLPPAFDPGLYLRLAQQHRATLLFMVPTMYQMLAEHPDFATADLGAVRWAIAGGAPCPEPVRRHFADKGVRFKQGYGLTEAGVNCFAMELEDAEQRPGSVGKPILNTEAVIRRPDGTPVARGETGELTLHGAHVFAGYWRRPEETAATLRDGWLWTGDLARQDDDGFFTITGRRKEMFISGGENVFPVEIENALYALPEVAECAVIGVPDARWGEVGLAAVALRPGACADAQRLREALRPKLARYKLPTHFLFLPALPKSGAGKILKPEIRKLYETTAPHASTERDHANPPRKNDAT
ncbi:MAG TPA: long-chain fatty acid--CoA ligase [Nevskiales bacterium]|nr:long-chain fatty acid--CoA ligase [Nevskiales bacterium]